MSKNIVLIGGSYGIGGKIVELLKEDHQVFIASRTPSTLSHPNITHIRFDVMESDLDPAVLPEETHGFVYLPGSINLKPFRGLSLDSFTKDMDINFFGAVKTLKAILPKMVDGGSVVLFSTVAVSNGMPFHASISAAKGAVEGLTRSLAAEYAPKIRFNAIAPSLVDTPLAERLLNNDAKREKMAERHPLQRIGNVNDIASAATFLLSDDASWITGQVLSVDGGISTINKN